MGGCGNIRRVREELRRRAVAAAAAEAAAEEAGRVDMDQILRSNETGKATRRLKESGEK